ncbi:Smr/MutS family protein [Salibaculum sp.]|uniref:Smr/MutS family protein n=1 Tax=Salibaculum sp. TaxID=2855480 RepID=UPI002B4A1072|nr:Smr/MutS family protein [Salibaculum sp.]HKL69103.1 Smr/MutS family protein [Salibaculum sp.]
MRRPRHLSPEERDLWDKVARTAKPLENRSEPRLSGRRKPDAKTPADDETASPVTAFRIGEKIDHSGDHDLLPSLGEQMGRAPIAMDRKTHGKLKRGKLKPEARIDLHGMTLAQAHPELTSFILSSQAIGRRLVLVITGKGKPRDTGDPIPTRLGVLRHQVPQWLRMPPLGPIVLQVSEAHARHGGHGAFYVYLRRRG